MIRRSISGGAVFGACQSDWKRDVKPATMAVAVVCRRKSQVLSKQRRVRLRDPIAAVSASNTMYFAWYLGHGPSYCLTVTPVSLSNVTSPPSLLFHPLALGVINTLTSTPR